MCPHVRHRLRLLVLQALVEVDGGGVRTGLSYCFLQICFQAVHAHWAIKRRWNIISKWPQPLITLTRQRDLLRTSFAGREHSKEGLQTPGWRGGKRERDASDDTTEEKRHCHCPFTYHRPTSPTWTGAFKTGNRCKDKTKESTAGGEKDGKKYQNNFIFLTL